MERVLTQKVNYLVNNYCYSVTIITTEQLERPIFYTLDKKITLIHLNINFGSHYSKGIFSRVLSHYSKLHKYKNSVEEIISRVMPDICISLCGKEIEFLGKLKADIPKIAELHFSMNFRKQFITSRKKGKLWALLGDFRTYQLKKSTKNLDKLVVLTTQDKAQWERTHKNIFQIPNPNPIESPKISEGQNKTVITVGRLDAQKGFDLLIDAWAVVAKRHQDWNLNIFGKGEWKEMLLEKINSKNLNTSVHLKGISSEIEHEYASSSIFVMSSRYEGFGMVLLEAMACGLPAVAFNCQWGPSDLIQNQVNGFLVPLFDINEMAEKIIYLIEHPDERKKMSVNAIEVSKKYNITEIMKKWNSLFLMTT